jgi:hypothetical protein
LGHFDAINEQMAKSWWSAARHKRRAAAMTYRK